MFPADFAIKIDRYVELRALVAEHRKLGDQIKAGLLASGESSYQTPRGCVARLRPGSPARTAWRWVAGKLKNLLSRSKFALCCPPTPDEAQLSAALAADPALAAGREEVSIPAGEPRLEVDGPL